MSVLTGPSMVERAECGLRGRQIVSWIQDPCVPWKGHRAEGRAGNILLQGCEQSVQEINRPQSKSEIHPEKGDRGGTGVPHCAPSVAQMGTGGLELSSK